MKPLNVALPLGIGDCWWSCQKLRSLSAYHGGRPIHVYVNRSPNHASIGFLRTVPWIAAVFEAADAPYAIREEMPPTHRDPRWSTLEGCCGWRWYDYVAVANGHLERGEHIASWWPELETDYVCELNIDDSDMAMARHFVPPGAVLLYLSGTGPNTGFHGGTWSVDNWVEVIDRLNQAGVRPALIGAATPDDRDYRDWVVRRAKRRQLDYIDAVGQTTQPQVLAMIREARAIAGLNSGLMIVGSALGTPTVMLWANKRYQERLPVNPEVLLPEAMATSWLNDEQLRTYRMLSYGSPELTPEAVATNVLALAR